METTREPTTTDHIEQSSSTEVHTALEEIRTLLATCDIVQIAPKIDEHMKVLCSIFTEPATTAEIKNESVRLLMVFQEIEATQQTMIRKVLSVAPRTVASDEPKRRGRTKRVAEETHTVPIKTGPLCLEEESTQETLEVWCAAIEKAASKIPEHQLVALSEVYDELQHSKTLAHLQRRTGILVWMIRHQKVSFNEGLGILHILKHKGIMDETVCGLLCDVLHELA